MKKTQTQITLPMPVDVGNAVFSYIKTGRPSSNETYIFIRSKAPFGKLTGKVCTRALYRILPERVEIKGGGFHVTRRTFATNLLRNRAEIDEVMDALGHRDPTSVMKNLLLDDEIKDLFRIIDEYRPAIQVSFFYWLSMEYRVIFRLLYCCGLLIS